MKECSKFPLPTVFQNWDQDPSHSDYNIFFNMLQNHSSVTLFTLWIHECLMNIYTKFYLPTVFQSWDMGPSLWILKCTLQVIKSCMTILIIFVYAFNRNKNAKLYLPSMFQTSDIEFLSPKTEIYTKSTKNGRIYKLCLYALEEHNCLILTSLFVPKLT